MTTRRRFVTQTAAITLGGYLPSEFSHADGPDKFCGAATGGRDGMRIKSFIRRDETFLHLGGDAGFGPFTWGEDDRQFFMAQDGAGWPEIPRDNYYSNQLFAVAGNPRNTMFEAVPGFPLTTIWDYISGSVAPYYATGMLAVDGNLFVFQTTGPRWNGEADLKNPKQHWHGARLIYSPNNGHTWYNQEGSTPVVQVLPENQSARNMTFFHESQFAFSLPTFLQMGRNYQSNRDGYIYVYSPNGVVDGTMNELVMFRVPKARLLDRNTYEYFAELRPDGTARWSKYITARSPIHTFPRGFVATVYAGSWVPCVVYNEPLNVYMMIATGTDLGASGAAAAHSNRSAGGVWISANPWGPWSQASDLELGAVPPKWIARDGRSFWTTTGDLNRTANEDFSEKDTDTPLYRAHSDSEFRENRKKFRENHPDFSLNLVRVDLIVG